MGGGEVGEAWNAGIITIEAKLNLKINLRSPVLTLLLKNELEIYY